MSDSTQSTHPVGRVLYEELLEEVITPIYSLSHTFLKDKCLVMQDKCNIEIFCPLLNVLTYLPDVYRGG